MDEHIMNVGVFKTLALAVNMYLLAVSNIYLNNFPDCFLENIGVFLARVVGRAERLFANHYYNLCTHLN